MDLRISVLALALYLALGLVTATVACLSFAYYHQPARGIEPVPTADGSRNGTRSRARRPVSSGAEASRRHEAYARAVHRVHYLEQMLAKQTELLDKKTTLLEKKNREYEAVRAELDEYIQLLGQLGVSEPARDPGAAQPPGERPLSAETAQLQAQVEQLEGQLAKSESAQRALEAQLAQLKEELNKTYTALAEQELAAMLDDDRSVRDASAEVLVRIGPAAVPLLAELLADEHAEVRSWAAAVLGQIGPPAGDAIPQLKNALSDPDQRVRSTARSALNSILD